MPWNVLLVWLFVLISYFAYNFEITAQQFFIHYAICQMIFLAGSAYGILWSAIIRNYEAVIAMISVILVPFLLVCGFFNANIPVWMIWLEYLSIAKFGFAAILENQYPNPVTCLDVNTNSTFTCDYIAVNFPQLR